MRDWLTSRRACPLPVYLDLQELGSLPAAELELYKGYGIKQLYKQLHECADKLKKYRYEYQTISAPLTLAWGPRGVRRTE